MIKKHVGRKRGAKERSNRSYTLYDSCDKCPLWVYMDLVCDEKLESLVINGKAPEDVLKEARTNLIIEFSQLSGDTHTDVINNILRKIYLYKNEINIFRICASLIVSGEYESSLKQLAKMGIRSGIPQNTEQANGLLKNIEGRIKGKDIYLQKEIKRYEELTKDQGENPKRQLYEEQIVVLSKHSGFKLDKNMTLAEYAAYLKDYKRTNEIKLAQHGNRK